jgi:hypothetical protein
MGFDYPSSPSVGQLYSGYVWDGEKWLAGSTSTPVVLAGWRNRLINGDMRVSQRGTSFVSPAASSYTLDRWRISYDGTGAFGVYPMDFNLTNPPARAAFRWQQTGAISGCSYRQVQQHIEGVETLAGQTATFSFSVYVVSGSISITPALYQVFGTGGSPSADVSIPGTPITCTGQARYSQTFAVPTTSGKTRGTNFNDNLIAYFKLPTTGTFDVYIWDVQLEEGAVATPFERRPIQTELALCQRYYQAHTGVLVSGYSLSGVPIYGDFSLPVTMRVYPTAAFVQQGSNGAGNISLNGGTSSHLQLIATASVTACVWSIANMSLDAEL